MSDRIYLREKSGLREDFRQAAKDTYDADVLEADFKHDSNQLVNEINKWVELETKNKIKDFLKQIDSNTVMMVINVVYFKAKWISAFDEEQDVLLEEFTNLNGEKKQVEMMCKFAEYPLGQFERYQILQLDYIDNSSMYVVLPNEDVNLDDLLQELDIRKLNDELSDLRPTGIDLQLPKFKLETKIDLKTVLEQLGVKTLFNEQADLSRLSNETGLRVSEAIQSAFISVDENGTEAAAVTEFDEFLCFEEEEKKVFHVNRPFVFIIRLNNVNIFVGAFKQF